LEDDKAILEKTTIVLQPKTIEQDSKYLGLPNSNLSDNTIRNPVFSGTESQTFILTITNKFGCSSTDTISVKVLKPIRIPNTFTPNSDGINDSWGIDQLKEYPGASVKVYNRYGVQLYNSIGYPQPWDGSYKGKTLSDGVYYYIIDTKFPGQVFSGSITIIR
jgi:gliding motility-associated-like protein